MDKGPWTRLYNNADECVGIVSDDFRHDVALRVSGDFESRAQFKAYCDWLIEKLNAIPQQGISAADCEPHKLEVGGSSPPPAIASRGNADV